MRVTERSLQAVASFDNLLDAWRKASKGKRRRQAAAAFELKAADYLLAIRDELLRDTWKPGPYTSFRIQAPKSRLISAAPFADRVVHHALCNVIEPEFERDFIDDSYANRVGKGTHRAIARLQEFAKQFRYVLRLDVVKHFPSLDHAILLETLGKKLGDGGLMNLATRIIASGEGVLEGEYEMAYFPGDDLFAALRPRGLPIGNLTSQFWSNCYMNPLDHFVKEELGCAAWIRYVDDMALLGDSKRQLWEWRAAILERLGEMRLLAHEESAQVTPVRVGIPWLGFVVYPNELRLKSRKAVEGTRRIGARFEAWREGRITFAEFDATVQGWINHVSFGDTWGLRRHVLDRISWGPEEAQR